MLVFIVVRRQDKALVGDAEQHGVCIVHRDESPRHAIATEWRGGRLRPERQTEAGEAPIQVLLVLLAESAIKDADFRIHDLIFGRAIGESRILALHHATVQETEVRRIDLALHGLEIIGLPLKAPDAPLFVIQPKRLKARKLGRRLPRPDIDPDESRPFPNAVGLCLDAVARGQRTRQVRRVDTIAFHVELPTMIDAANTVMLVAAEEKRCAAMRAFLIHNADTARRIAKAINCSPSSLSRNGAPSGASSDDMSAGIQYSRMSSPIGVPGPTLVRTSESAAVVIYLSRPL